MAHFANRTNWINYFFSIEIFKSNLEGPPIVKSQ